MKFKYSQNSFNIIYYQQLMIITSNLGVSETYLKQNKCRINKNNKTHLLNYIYI